jgi:hypothetical protein
VGNPDGKFGRKRCQSREKYQTTLDALDAYIERFYKALTEMDFSLENLPYKTCGSCDFKTICRSLYSLNSPLNSRSKESAFWRFDAAPFGAAEPEDEDDENGEQEEDYDF